MTAVCEVGLDCARQITRKHLRACGQHYFSKTTGAAAGFEDRVPAQHLEISTEGVRQPIFRDGCVSVGVELTLSELIPLQTETCGVVRRIDEARYASHDGHPATARAFEFGTSLDL